MVQKSYSLYTNGIFIFEIDCEVRNLLADCNFTFSKQLSILYLINKFEYCKINKYNENK